MTAELAAEEQTVQDAREARERELETWYKVRRAGQEAVREEIGEYRPPALSKDLRVQWGEEQRREDGLRQLVADCERSSEKVSGEYRVAEDGVLERRLWEEEGPAVWRPVVPKLWREWVFRYAHVGIMGAHRSGKKTAALLLKICWWKDIAADCERFCEHCLTCLKGRKKAAKTEPTELQCWEEVTMDCEGPMLPADAHGNRFILSYLCSLSHFVMLEPMKDLSHSEVRRAFARLLFRSRTLPKLLRTDCGQEFRNALMQEFCAIVGIRQHFSTPMRPVEMGACERMHQESQKVLGLLVHDVCKAHPHEWGELLYVLWSLSWIPRRPRQATVRGTWREVGRWPLEKELLPFSVLEWEPISEYAKKLFRNYRDVRAKILEKQSAMAEARARLANRFRKKK